MFFEDSSSSVSWNPNKHLVLECRQATVRSACLGIFKPTQALNLFASIQQNAPHWVRELQVYVVILLGIWRKFPCFIHVIITPYRSHSWSLYHTPNDNRMWKEFMFALKYSYEDPAMGFLLKFSPCRGFHLYPPSISSIIEMSHPVAPKTTSKQPWWAVWSEASAFVVLSLDVEWRPQA